MSDEEAIKMLEAKLECMIRDVSGIDDDCNCKRCNECHLNYEQGNMGEQIEYLSMSIEALKQRSIFDKIKEDILQCIEQTETTPTLCREEVLTIISKYKESEE